MVGPQRVGHVDDDVHSAADCSDGLGWVSAETDAAIPPLYATVGLEPWGIMALVLVGALLDAPGATARAAVHILATEAYVSSGETSCISQSCSPVCDPVRACAVIWPRSGYSTTSGDG